MKNQPYALAVALSGFAALAVAMGIGRFAFTPILPMMQDDYGLSVAEAGWLASANYVGYLLGGLSAVWLRIEARTAIRSSLAAIAATTLATGLTDQFAAWMFLRALAGVGSAWALVFVSAWCLERLAPFSRPVLGSVVFAGVGAGIALSGGLCLVLMKSGAAASEAWLALGLVACALTVLVWPIFGSDAAHPAADNPTASQGLFRWNREAIVMVVCYGVFGFGYIVPATFVPAMAKEIIRDPAVFGWSWPLFGMAALVSTIGASGMMKTLGNRRVWTLGALVMAAGVAAPAVLPGIGAVMFAALCVGGTFMVLTMAGLQEARRVGAAHARALMAAMTSSFATGQIAGPLAVSWFTRGNIDAVLIAAAVLLAASAAAIALNSVHERKTDEALSQ